MSVVLDPIMLAQLTSDLSRILKMNMVHVDNDTSACYDQIIVLGMLLAARRCGMPETAISTHSSAQKIYAVCCEDDAWSFDTTIFWDRGSSFWHRSSKAVAPPKKTNSIITCCRDVLGI